VRLMALLVGLLMALASAPIALAMDTVTIRVQDEAGTPIAGASIELWVSIGDASDATVGTTDDDGLVSLLVDVPAGERTYLAFADATFVDTIEGCERTLHVDGKERFVGDLPPDPWVITATTWTTYKCQAPPDGSPMIHVTYSTPDGGIPEISGAGFSERRGDGVTYHGALRLDGDGLSGTVYDWPDATLSIGVNMPLVLEPPDKDGCVDSTQTIGQTTVPLAEALAGPIHVTLDRQVEGRVCGETSAPNVPDMTLPPTDSAPGKGSPANQPSPVWILLALVGAGIVIARRPFTHRDGRDA
jgi:hypothetical protein